MSFNPDSKRRLYERQILHNLTIDDDFKEAYLDCLGEDNFSHIAGRAMVRTLKECGEITDGFNTGFSLTPEDHSFINLLRDDFPSRETSWEKLQDYVDYLRETPVEEDGVEDAIEKEEETKLKEDDKKGLSSMDKLYAYLEKNSNRSVSLLEIAEFLKVGKSRISALIKEDKEKNGMLRVIQVGKRKFLSMRSEKGFTKVVEEVEKVETLGKLPGNLHHLIGTKFGGQMKRETFFGVIGFTDFGKTQFLLNLAVHFAQSGKKVAYIRHESDSLEYHLDVGRRLLGRSLMSSGPAIEEMKKTGLDENLTAWVAPEEANLDEFCETIVEEIKPDIVVYDYLSQELVDIAIPEQRSVIAAIVNKLGDHLVSNGIGLFTAVQLESRNGEFKVNPKWLRRMNVALWIRTTRSDADGRFVLLCDVVKNKQGGARGGQFIELSCDPSTWQFDKSELLTREEVEERWGKRVLGK